MPQTAAEALEMWRIGREELDEEDDAQRAKQYELAHLVFELAKKKGVVLETLFEDEGERDLVFQDSVVYTAMKSFDKSVADPDEDDAGFEDEDPEYDFEEDGSDRDGDWDIDP